MSRRKENEICPYNHYVNTAGADPYRRYECTIEDCEHCGWNPVVEKKRKAQLREGEEMTKKERVLNEICNHYCRFPHEVSESATDLTKAQEKLDEICSDCPLERMIGNIEYDD